MRKRLKGRIWYSCRDFPKSCAIWKSIFITTFDTTINLQRKWGIDTKIKAIKRESKSIMWLW